MRSMFNSAPFSRFDLGRHILGQAQCPPGKIPLLQNGEVVCVEGFTPGGMMAPAEPNPQMTVPNALPTTTMGQVLPAVPGAQSVAAPVLGDVSPLALLVGGAVALGLGLLLLGALGGEK